MHMCQSNLGSSKFNLTPVFVWVQAAEILLEAGADTTLRGECEWAEKKTALEWAEINGHAEVTALLRG